MSSRDAIFTRLRANRPAGDFPLPDIPAFAPLFGEDRVQEFGERLKRMGGRVEPMVEGSDPLERAPPKWNPVRRESARQNKGLETCPDPTWSGTALASVREPLNQAKVVASAVPEITGNRDLATVKKPADLEDVDVAVVRAAFGIAETGSVLFTERELVVNAVAYLAQHLIVLLDPADIVDTVQAAYRRPEFGKSAYAVLHTGPSATADIEGVLIHGAQGVRSLTVVLAPRSDATSP